MVTNLRYRIDQDDERLQKLRGFLDLGERTRPVAFAGRKEIFNRIQRLVASFATGRKLDSISQVIVGAPGAGKTSLLFQLQTVFEGSPTTKVIYLNGGHLSDTPAVFANYAFMSTGVNLETLAALGGSSGEASLMKIAGYKHKWDRRQPSISEILDRDVTVWQVLKELLSLEDNDVLLILIDEAQSIQPLRGATENQIVKDLHNGDTAPINALPVFAGLSDTETTLANVGISRLSEDPTNLSSLALDEAEEAVTGFIQHPDFRLNELFGPQEYVHLARSLAVASEGWPRHLHHYLQGLADALLTDLSRSTPSGTVHLDEILEYGHDRRISYYERRMRIAELGKFEEVLMNVTKDRLDSITLSLSSIEDSAMEILGMSSKDVTQHVKKCVQIGLLEPHGSLHMQQFRFPIASLASYIRFQGDMDRTKNTFAHRTAKGCKHSRENSRQVMLLNCRQKVGLNVFSKIQNVMTTNQEQPLIAVLKI